MDIQTQERFTRFIAPEPNCGCWLWTGCDNGNGYGMFRVDGKNVYAHRISYELHKGPIPEKLVIDHKCRVHRCVNPDHLEPVTFNENVRRGVGISVVNAKKTHCRNGHEFTSENTWYEKNGSRHCRRCHADRQYVLNRRLRGKA